MKTLSWVLFSLCGWLTLSALVETIEGYAFLDTFRLRVILAVTYLALCTVGVAKIISIGRSKHLPLRVFVVGIACFVAVAAVRSLVPSAQASILIALTLSSVPFLILGLRDCFGRRSSSIRNAASPTARLEFVQEGSFAVDRAA